jgi:hypothetical protein
MSVVIGWEYIRLYSKLADPLVALPPVLLFKHWAGVGIFGYYLFRLSG